MSTIFSTSQIPSSPKLNESMRTNFNLVSVLALKSQVTIEKPCPYENIRMMTDDNNGQTQKMKPFFSRQSSCRQDGTGALNTSKDWKSAKRRVQRLHPSGPTSTIRAVQRYTYMYKYNVDLRSRPGAPGSPARPHLVNTARRRRGSDGA